MIDAARRRVTTVRQDREREIAVTHVGPAGLRGVDHLHAKDLSVKLGEPRGIFGLDGQVTDLRRIGHEFPPL